MDHRNFKDVSIFIKDKKQTINVLKEGQNFKPSKHGYYRVYITIQDVIQMYNALVKKVERKD